VNKAFIYFFRLHRFENVQRKLLFA
jgi:hypothetical protein